MQTTDNNLDTEIRIWQERLFNRSIRRNRKLRRIANLTGSTNSFQCLEISSGDGVISANLRSLGGSWKTAVTRKEAADSIGYNLSEPVTLIEGSKLPFEDHTFDRVVIIDALKGTLSDYEFIKECHRVLKTEGWVIIHETRRMPASLASLIRQIAGTTPIATGDHRNGYTGKELFNILKDGFDVPETIIYSNGAMEAITAITYSIQKIMYGTPYWFIRERVGQDELYRYRKLNGLTNLIYPLLWLTSKFEFLPAHQLLVKSRRRHWRPRQQPKLLDGRSIAEATINTKIGTAAPF